MRSNGRLARSGVSLSGRQRGEEAEARNADRADHRIEAAGERIVDRAAADQLERGAERLPARRARGVHRRRVAADVVQARQQRDTRGGLAAAEGHRIVRRGIAQHEPVVDVAIGRAVIVRRGEIDVVARHHRGADGAAPARGRLLGRPDAGIDKCLLGGGEREPMRAVRELQRLAGAGTSSSSNPLTSAAMRTGKAARVEKRDGRPAAAAREQRVPGRRDVVADRRDEPDAGDCDASFRFVHPRVSSTGRLAPWRPSGLRRARSARRRWRCLPRPRARREVRAPVPAR